MLTPLEPSRLLAQGGPSFACEVLRSRGVAAGLCSTQLRCKHKIAGLQARAHAIVWQMSCCQSSRGLRPSMPSTGTTAGMPCPQATSSPIAPTQPSTSCCAPSGPLLCLPLQHTPRRWATAQPARRQSTGGAASPPVYPRSRSHSPTQQISSRRPLACAETSSPGWSPCSLRRWRQPHRARRGARRRCAAGCGYLSRGRPCKTSRGRQAWRTGTCAWSHWQ